MKQLIRFNPAFSPGAAGQGYIDFSGMLNFTFGRLYAVINATTNQPLYIAGASGYGLTRDLYNHDVYFIQVDTSTGTPDDEINVYYEMYPIEPNSIGVPSLLGTNVSQEQGGQLEALHEKLDAVLVELKLMNEILIQGLIGRPLDREDSVSLRNDITNVQSVDNIRTQL